MATTRKRNTAAARPAAVDEDAAALERARAEAIRRSHRALIIKKARHVAEAVGALLEAGHQLLGLLCLGYEDREVDRKFYEWLGDTPRAASAVAAPEHDPELADHLRHLADEFARQLLAQESLVGLVAAALEIEYSQPLRAGAARQRETPRDGMVHALVAEGQGKKLVARIMSAPGIPKAKRNDAQQRQYDAVLTQLKRISRADRKAAAAALRAGLRKAGEDRQREKATQEAARREGDDRLAEALMRRSAPRKGGQRSPRD